MLVGVAQKTVQYAVAVDIKTSGRVGKVFGFFEACRAAQVAPLANHVPSRRGTLRGLLFNRNTIRPRPHINLQLRKRCLRPLCVLCYRFLPIAGTAAFTYLIGKATALTLYEPQYAWA